LKVALERFLARTVSVELEGESVRIDSPYEGGFSRLPLRLTVSS
jgi:hypothetical protein